MAGLAPRQIDDTLTFYAQTFDPSDGGQEDSTSPPTYRVYEDETTTPILTGSMALLDASNTDGFYSEAITLSAANGFEDGKDYCVRMSAANGAVTGAAFHTFHIQAGFPLLAATQTSIDAVEVDTGTTIPATIADVPTVAEFNARTLAAAAYFDPAVDTVGTVTNVGTVTGNVDGSVASVTGAVGSVAGNVDGNVSGTVILANGAHGGAAAAITLADYSDFTGAAAANPTVLQTTTIATLASQTSFTLTAGAALDDVYNGCLVVITDDGAATNKTLGIISDYVGISKTVTLEAAPGGLTVAVPDAISIIAVPNAVEMPELAVGLPPITPSERQALMLMYMALRNKIDVTSALLEIHNNAGAIVTKKVVSDDGSIYSEAKMVSG